MCEKEKEDSESEAYKRYLRANEAGKESAEKEGERPEDWEYYQHLEEAGDDN